MEDEINKSDEGEYDRHEPWLLLYDYCIKEYGIPSYPRLEMNQVREFNFQVARCGNGGHIRLKRKWIGKRVRVTIEEAREPYTEREKEYLQAHKNEIAWDRRLDEMITYLTGKTAAQQGEIIGRTPKTENRRKVLVDESKGHMVKLFFIINPEIPLTLLPLLTSNRVYSLGLLLSVR